MTPNKTKDRKSLFRNPNSHHTVKQIADCILQRQNDALLKGGILSKMTQRFITQIPFRRLLFKAVNSVILS